MVSAGSPDHLGKTFHGEVRDSEAGEHHRSSLRAPSSEPLGRRFVLPRNDLPAFRLHPLYNLERHVSTH